MAKTAKKKLTLNDAIDGFWTVREMEFSPRTVVTYGYYFKAFVEYIGGDNLFEKITTEDVRRFLNYLINEKSLSKRSSCDHWVALSSLWTWAEKELGVKHIIREIPRPRFTKKVIEPLTEAELKSILKQTTHKRVKRSNGTVYHAERDTALRDKAIIMVLLDTGIRASELCDLKNADYDPKKGKLFVRHGKGDKERMLFLGANAKRALWRYLNSKENFNKPHKSLFNVTRSPNGKPMSRSDLFRLIQRLAKKAGITGCNVHRFRHTFAINFLRNGGTVLMLQHLLGHESLDIVKIYVKLSEIDAEKSAEYSTVDRWDL